MKMSILGSLYRVMRREKSFKSEIMEKTSHVKDANKIWCSTRKQENI